MATITSQLVAIASDRLSSINKSATAALFFVFFPLYKVRPSASSSTKQRPRANFRVEEGGGGGASEVSFDNGIEQKCRDCSMLELGLTVAKV